MTTTASAQRVPANTNPKVNEQIRRMTEANIAYFSQHPDQIDRRLRELDEEWDIERTLEANAATITLFGGAMSLLFGRKWAILPMVVGGFLLQHALEGWCPPLPVFRRMGTRTRFEIDTERYALKALRGDFRNISQESSAEEAAQAACR